MSEQIEAMAGNTEPRLPCTFDGKVLELWDAPSGRYLPNQLVLQKRKDDKDGGVSLFIVPSGAARRQLYFAPDELANMEKLLTALTAAGMQSDG